MLASHFRARFWKRAIWTRSDHFFSKMHPDNLSNMHLLKLVASSCTHNRSEPLKTMRTSYPRMLLSLLQSQSTLVFCFQYNVAPLPLPNDLLHLAPPMGPVARTQHKTLLLIWAGKCRGPCSRRRLLWLRWFQSLHRRSGRGTNTDRVPWQVGFSSSMMSIPGPVTSCIRQHMLNVRLILHRA